MKKRKFMRRKFRGGGRFRKRKRTNFRRRKIIKFMKRRLIRGLIIIVHITKI